MEQNRDPRNRPIEVQSADLEEGSKAKLILSTNGARTTKHPYDKKNIYIDLTTFMKNNSKLNIDLSVKCKNYKTSDR